MTTKRPQTHISIAVRGFNVKLPIDLGIELRFCLGFALGKHPLQVPLCISLWAHRPSSALLNHACTVANCIKCGNQSKASPFQIFLWQSPWCKLLSMSMSMSITFWAPNPYSAPCSLPLERMNHKPTCHFSGALSDLASSVQKSHENDPTTNFYFLTISLPLRN